jgi:hypothetical protein
MTSALRYKLVGYDRDTELLAAEHPLPTAAVERAKSIAGIADRSEIIGDWPLSTEQARSIARIAAIMADLDRYDWFLEPYFSARVD